MDRAIDHLLPSIAVDIEDVLDAAAAWDAGQMPLNAAAHVGTILYRGFPSCRYSRWVAIAKTPRTDPRWQALNRMVNVIASAERVSTHQGLFSRDELHQHDAAIFALRFSKAA